MSEDGHWIRHRRHYGGGWTHLTNDFIRDLRDDDGRRNPDAVAIGAELYSNADGWTFTIQGIADSWGISFRRASVAVKLLRDRGYIHFCRVSQGRGTMSTWYDLSDVPVEDCGEQACVDCAARRQVVTPLPVSDSQNRVPDTDVSAGRIGCASIGTRYAPTQIEDHSTEDHLFSSSEDTRAGVPAGREPAPGELFAVDVPVIPRAEVKPARPRPPDRFEEFYAAYPRHIGKQAARRAWIKVTSGITAVEPRVIIDGAVAFAAASERTDPKYIPYPATWLNAGRWDDELEEAEPERRTVDPAWMLGKVGTRTHVRGDAHWVTTGLSRLTTLRRSAGSCRR